METLKFGKICTPSELVEGTIVNATRIVSSFGGGMGGARNTYYALMVDNTMKPLETTIKTVDGRTIKLGYKFIVSQEEVRLLKIIHDVTDHRNYNVDNSRRVKKAVTTEYHVLYGNEEFEITNEYIRRVGKNDRVIFSDVNVEK